MSFQRKLESPNNSSITKMRREIPAFAGMTSSTGLFKKYIAKRLASSYTKNNRCSDNNRGVMLDVFITSRVRRKIIVIYAKYPDFKTHVRGLAKLIKEDAGNIQRELKRLEKVGFLTSERQGNTKVYSTNKQFPIFRELQSIVLKSQRTTQQKRVTG